MHQPSLLDDEPAQASATGDPLGQAYCDAHPPSTRRSAGITFTPQWLVDCMLQRLARHGGIDTIVDAGAGSGRFAMAAARAFPRAQVIAVENSPQMLELLRANLVTSGLGGRVTVVADDFRQARLTLNGRTAFIGNPPFVRHHELGADWKAWYASGMRSLGQAASQLAGLHAHFMLRCVQAMRPGDVLLMVAAAEWLDNGYGSALRALLSSPPIGITGLWVAPPDEPVFPDALVSAVVFEAQRDASTDSVTLGLLRAHALEAVRQLPADHMVQADRWSRLCQPGPLLRDIGVELGELFQVVRGQVTGCNAAWVVASGQARLLPGLTVAAVTRAREIIDGGVDDPVAAAAMNHVVDLPADLDGIHHPLRATVEAFLARARALGAADGYVARQRRHWHAVGMRPPPDGLVSYMGRRPPVFRTNPARLSYINIAHGLYQRQPLGRVRLQRIFDHLNVSTGIFSGRVYGGGLAKFEPSDISRLRLPADVIG